jgi:DNA uptake protein ComE-like DNA-binding protein
MRMLHSIDRPTTALMAAALFIGGCGGDSGATEDAASAASDTPAAMVESAAPAAEAAAQGTGALVNPNEADAAAIAAVPGLDSAAVAIILEGRPFETMIPLHEALSARMDSAALEAVYAHMFIPLDLNAASEEEILLIPGVGSRMAYEFDEYRPYEAIERFRREIGKYVDDEEIARLEQYVVIR